MISIDGSLVAFSVDSPSILAIIASVSSVGSPSSPMSGVIMVVGRRDEVGLLDVMITGLDAELSSVSELNEETELAVVESWESVSSCDVAAAVVVEVYSNERSVVIGLLADKVSVDGISVLTAV